MICKNQKGVLHFFCCLWQEGIYMARLSEFADLDSALEHILMGIFILDREGNYLYVNEQYCQSIGRPPEFYREMSIPRLKKMGYLSSSVWEQVLREQRTVISVVSVTDQGVTTPYLTVGTPQFDEHGEIRQIVCRQESVKRLNELLQHGSRNRYQVSRDGLERQPFRNRSLLRVLR